MNTGIKKFFCLALVALLFFDLLAYLPQKAFAKETKTVAKTAAKGEVTAINWKNFAKGAPSDPASQRIREILLNANKYALTTWFAKKGFDQQTGEYLSFSGISEANIRPAADEAFSLAVSLKTQAYDPQKTGVPYIAAQEHVKKLIASLAFHHLANEPGGWGNSWQSALWASTTAFAGWLMWDSLLPKDQENIRKMVIYESNRFNLYASPYYRDPSGKINYPGDTKAEENSWNSTILQMATGMMPTHPNKKIWQSKMLELMISAFTRPSDVGSAKIVQGRPLALWIAGSNINEDGSLINHNILHPDYMTEITSNLNLALVYALAGNPIPEAFRFNADLVYQALASGKFFGRTIYQKNSSAIGYPQGTDWGYGRRMNFVLADVEAGIFGLDKNLMLKAPYWENLHSQAALNMQKRSADGRTYLYYSEDRYPGREEWVANLAAQAYLAKWLANQGTMSFTSSALPYIFLKK